MGGMDMGMDMTSEGPFRPTNQKIAKAYWYIIAGAVGALIVIRVVQRCQSKNRKRRHSRWISTVPTGCISQAWATATAIIREMSYPQPIYFTGRICRYFSPLPLGRWLILVAYWTLLLCFLWTGTILAPNSAMYTYKWEMVGFRAAWVSVSQIPFIYLLSCKYNPITLLTGISYERFNWLHRWSARTVFLTIIVHWSFFFTEWSKAGYVELEINMMPMVKYGFGAWATIGWMVLSGFAFFRQLNYELFVAQHICAAATLLWLLHTHVPSYARYNIYLSVGFVAFDWSARIIWALVRNTHMLGRVGTTGIGYAVRLEPLAGDMVRIRFDDVDFDWRAGQHAYISIPRIRPFELHPFTIANAAQSSRSGGDTRLEMVVKARSGFTKALRKAAVRQSVDRQRFCAFISGPWGQPPDLCHYQSIVLIACASGASFTVPLLQRVLRSECCASQISFHWIIRSEKHFEWFGEDLLQLLETARRRRLGLHINIHVTQSCPQREVGNSLTRAVDNKSMNAVSNSSETASSSDSVLSASKSNSIAQFEGQERHSSSSLLFINNSGRPAVDCLIRPTVEAALGETAVVVCGGLSVTAQARNSVAHLSDERAVHKGSGAQGISLFTESYGY